MVRPSQFTEKLQNFTQNLSLQGLYRKRQFVCDSALLNFSSNDYLSLCTHPQIKESYQEGFAKYPTGSGGSMLVCGYHPIHQELEEGFAEALQVDACILFSSGYAANLSVANLLSELESYVIVDKNIHASVYDGLKLSNVAYSRYLHNDLHSLSSKISAYPQSVVITEGVFSMSGKIPDLQKINQICRKHHSTLLVDEAHAFGIFGPQGLGSVMQHQLTQDEVPLRVIPFGKALASQGALIAGKKEWIEGLLQVARPHIYSTAMSPALTFGLLQTLKIIRAADSRRDKLQELIHYFRSKIADTVFKWEDSMSPIQQLQLGCPHQACSLADALKKQSIVCLPMRQPTVNKLETGLRISLNYDHNVADIDRLFACLLECAQLHE
jgi:8-amino-7-oxononanoate synthase